MLYAQDKPKQKLHLVEETDEQLTGFHVRQVAFCGRKPSGDTWRMTVNVPLKRACKKCAKAYAKQRAA